MSITTKTCLHAGRGCKPARRGEGEIKDGAMKSDFRGSSLYGSTSEVRGWCSHERYSSDGTGTKLPRAGSDDVLRDEDRKLCGSSLSWKWGEVAGVELVE